MVLILAGSAESSMQGVPKTAQSKPVEQKP